MKDLSQYNISFPYGATTPPYSPAHPHRGADRKCPIGTPVIINGVTIGLTGNSGSYNGQPYAPHCHIQAWVGDVANTRNPAPYEFKGGTVINTGVGPQWGNFVTILVDGVNVTYAHLSKINVKKGDRIPQGEPMVPWNNSQTYNLMYHCLTPAIAERARKANFVGYFGLQGNGSWPQDKALDAIITSQQWGLLKQEAFPAGGNIAAGTYLKINKDDVKEVT